MSSQQTPWPQFDGSTPQRLAVLLNSFFAARAVSDCQAPIEGLLALAGVNISPLEKTGRSLWNWYTTWLSGTQSPPSTTRVQFALFADEYHDSFAQQANPIAVAVLGTATAEQLDMILVAGFTACRELDPGSQLLANHPVLVADLERAWSNQLGRPIEHLTTDSARDGTSSTGGDVVAGILAEAEAGDEAQQALVAAAVAQSEGRLEEALAHLEHGARLGNVDAMMGAAQAARELGRPGVDGFWTEAAAQAGSPEAMFNMGFAALESNRLEDASRWFQASGARGNAEAYAALIEVAERRRDSAGAAQWAETGAKLEHPRCLEVHALTILRGNEQNPAVFQRAISLLESAASQGYAPAMDRCGILHFHSGNPTQAKYWWEQADAAGDPDARGRLVKYRLA